MFKVALHLFCGWHRRVDVNVANICQSAAVNLCYIYASHFSKLYYLLEAANSVRRCDSEFRRYYDLKYKEVNKHQHKRALALTARKLVRLVFRLLKDNRLYKLPEG